MDENLLQTNIQNIILETKNGNLFNEPITVCMATKMVDVQTINKAIDLGLNIVADNKVQEFNQKYPDINKNATFHFIGRLQKNKVKYLIGKVSLIQSVDSFDLAQEISKQSKNKNVVTNILIQINVAKEESKGGFYLEDAIDALTKISKLDNIVVKGYMAMLPNTDNQEYLQNLCKKMRNVYEKTKEVANICYLSMGMSNDYKTAINCGSNMIRLGSCLFGKRNYQKENQYGI